jgi:hypothetical protein
VSRCDKIYVGLSYLHLVHLELRSAKVSFPICWTRDFRWAKQLAKTLALCRLMMFRMGSGLRVSCLSVCPIIEYVITFVPSVYLLLLYFYKWMWQSVNTTLYSERIRLYVKLKWLTIIRPNYKNTKVDITIVFKVWDFNIYKLKYKHIF